MKYTESSFLVACRERMPEVEVSNTHKTYRVKIDENWSYQVNHWADRNCECPCAEIHFKYNPDPIHHKIASYCIWATKCEGEDWLFQKMYRSMIA